MSDKIAPASSYDITRNIEQSIKRDADLRKNRGISVLGGSVDQTEDSSIRTIHHSLMRQKITDLKILRSYVPVTLIIGKSGVGKSTAASILSTNPATTTIFEEWNDCNDWIAKEMALITKQKYHHIETDNQLSKKMFQRVTVSAAKEGEKNQSREVDVTHNRPRSVKFTQLIEAVYDKEFIITTVIEPAISCLMSNKFNGVKYKPGEIPVVYYNESLQDAIFHFDAFFLISTEGQESGGSRHRVTLQVRRPEVPDTPKRSRKSNMIGEKYAEHDSYGEHYITCYPLDIMAYFALIGPVRVTSVNSSTFSSKHVISNTQKGGLSDSVVNTPNYFSNMIRKFGGVAIFEIRDDWDKVDTLFGAGDMAIEILRGDSGRPTVGKFRLRDGSLDKREYYAELHLYEIIFHITLRCLHEDKVSDFQLLNSVIIFMDDLLEFVVEQKLKVEQMLLDNRFVDVTDITYEQSTEEKLQIEQFVGTIEDLVSDCEKENMVTETNLFKKMKDIFN